MRYLCLVFLLLSLPVFMGSVIYERGSMKGFLYGEEDAAQYDNWISHISEGIARPGFNKYAPWERQTDGFGAYLTPTDTELQNWRLVISAFTAGDFQAVRDYLYNFDIPYQLVLFSDVDTGREYYILRENLNDDYDDNGTDETWDDQHGSFDYGWGLYVMNIYSDEPVIISAPHPKDDYPSPVMALYAFEKTNARYLMIAGAGREVSYPYSSYPNNDASISDPSRVTVHPFNVAYQSFADQIRTSYSRQEFSLQVHTYDWAAAQDHSSVLLSAGNGRDYPSLPIRDFSRRKVDIINRAPYQIHAAGSIGDNEVVNVDDYYGAYYQSSRPVYYDKDGYYLQIPLNHSYPGATGNQQMLYTLPENTYDVFNPFLHVEMDELPGSYPQDEEYWQWFYGYNHENQCWEPQNRWTKFEAYYSLWIDDLAVVLAEMLRMDDYQQPSYVELPRIEKWSYYYNQLVFDRSYCYDFDSYEVNFRSRHYTGEITEITVDREDYPNLAGQGRAYLEDWADLVEEYSIAAIKVRARDKNGNYSAWSNSFLSSKPSNLVEDIEAQAVNEGISISWEGNSFGGAATLGFNVYRSTDGSNYSLLDSWQQNPDLVPPNPNSASYTDTQAEPDTRYWYRLGRCFANGYEYLHWEAADICFSLMNSLVLTNETTLQSYTWQFAHQVGAGDGYVYGVDLRETTSLNDLPLALVTSLPGYYTNLKRDIREAFDPQTELKEINLKLWAPNPSQSYTICLNSSLEQLQSMLYLYDPAADSWFNLRQQSYTYISTGATIKELILYWGALSPDLEFLGESDQFLSLGSNASLQWLCNYPGATESYSLSLVNVHYDIPLLESIAGDALEAEYQVPDACPMGIYRYKLTMHSAFGPDESYISEYRVHILDDMYQLDLDQGWQLISFPVGNIYTTLYDLLGDGNRLYTIAADGTWMQTEEIVANRAYLLYLDHPQSLALPNDPQENIYSFELSNGWNLVPNPHQKDYPLSMLSFNHTGEILSFAEAGEAGLIETACFGLTSGVWQAQSIIPRASSSLLKYMGDEDMQIVFNPNVQYPPPPEPDLAWCAALSFGAANEPSSSVVFGSSDQGSIAVDALLDYSARPILPGASIIASVFQDDSEALSTAFRELYPDYNTVEKSWCIGLHVPANGVYTAQLIPQSLPPDYAVFLVIGSYSLRILPGEPRSLELAASDTLLATLRVISQYSLHIQDESQVYPALSIYPNPFHDNAIMEVDSKIGDIVKLSVFNLRGQLVRRISGEAASTGKNRLVWDGRDSSGLICSPGIYYLHIENGSKTERRKLIKLP